MICLQRCWRSPESERTTEGVRVKFLQQDMRSLSLRGRFDLVTCWFDSLNYLLEIDDLARTFAGVSRVLDENGVFIFDVNTIRGLAVEWVREPSYVHLNSGDSFLVSVPQYDAATKIASLHITGFSQRERTMGQDRRSPQGARLHSQGDPAMPEESRSA